mmetsp:Transcript_5697/g.16296  ORF Transcript_5697/g.16296 Transcript_5697/m.16296 type:complete len:689 (+) Transcript_5697:368-2434(+)|eukprot:CAMPEP_0172359946 /NCGR_PEP_ID=MMETSP1060-20121228/4056_1 /TAXON_ID=37318 /ORGANISM="Pseudo-nitzschia pungens, Strain cf. cingulata" /LENGTH=688 /DNA_ID=CAMNT_0013081775 /DNA_START=337 /DNA_END=2403 /DNA_ORIENTATION=-
MMVVDTTTNSDVLSKKGASDPSVAMMIVPQSKEEQHVKGNSSSTKSSTFNKRNNKKSSSSHNTRASLSDSPKDSLSEEVVPAGGQDHKKIKSSCKSRSTSSSVSDLEGKCKDEGKKEKKSKKKSLSLTSLSKVGNDSSTGASLLCDDESIGKHRVAPSDLTTNIVDSAIESSTKKNTAQLSGSSHSRSSVKSSATSKTNASNKKKKKKSSEKTGIASKEVRKKCPPSISSTSRDRRELSFASIHGRSIHKTNKKRVSVGNGSEPVTRKMPPAVLSSSDRDGSVKKKSALKLKKEKQLLKKKQEHDERDKQVAGSPTTVAKEKEDSIQKGLDISTVDSVSNSSIDDSCSIVSDGSYSADDLLFGDGNASQDPIPPSSIHSNESSGATLGDNTLNDSGRDPHVEASETMDDIIFDDQDEQRSSCDDQQKSSSTFLSSDTITPSLASSMSSFPEEDLDFTASPETSSSSPSTSSPKPSLLRNLSSKIKKIKLPLSQQQQQQLTAQPSIRQTQDSQVAANTLSKSETNVLRIKLPGRNRTITRHRSIGFNEKVRVKRIPCQAQMLEEHEVGKLWFQPEEYDVIKRKTMALIKAIQEENTGGVTYCTRGLERYFSIEEVQDKRNDAWDTVLDEQERQRSVRSFDAERMARIYARITKASFREAMQRGRLDEDAIVKYMRKARQSYHRSFSAPV